MHHRAMSVCPRTHPEAFRVMAESGLLELKRSSTKTLCGSIIDSLTSGRAMNAVPDHLECRTCGETKPVSQFHD